MSATINQRAFELRRKLFELAGECKQLSVLAQHSIGDLDSRLDAAGQLDDVGGRLFATHDSLGDVFIDAARDEKDQRFSLLIREQQWESNHIHTTPDGRHFRHGDGVEVDGDGNEIVVNENGTYRTEEYQISEEDRVVIEWDGESRTIRTYTRGTAGSLYAGDSLDAAAESLGIDREAMDAALLASDPIVRDADGNELDR